jgi:hypothetical protein
MASFPVGKEVWGGGWSHGAAHLLPSSAIVRNERSRIFVRHYMPSWYLLGQLYSVSYLRNTCYTLCTITVTHRLMGIHFEKCIFRQFRIRASVTVCTYTDLDKPCLRIKCMADLVN